MGKLGQLLRKTEPDLSLSKLLRTVSHPKPTQTSYMFQGLGLRVENPKPLNLKPQKHEAPICRNLAFPLPPVTIHGRSLVLGSHVLDLGRRVSCVCMKLSVGPLTVVLVASL